MGTRTERMMTDNSCLCYNTYRVMTDNSCSCNGGSSYGSHCDIMQLHFGALCLHRTVSALEAESSDPQQTSSRLLNEHTWIVLPGDHQLS